MSMMPRHPIYIVSKGRAERQLTSAALHRMGVPHFIVVEADEEDLYIMTALSTATVIVLDHQYLKDYDTCDDLGETKGKGPGAARNYAWAHSLEQGATWHWVLDDNINTFYRLNRNMKHQVDTGGIFAAAEDFVNRYTNVAISGFHYEMFAPRKYKLPPFYLNTRIYSCILMRNDLPYRWRARYNEDTDISLRALKDGWCTVLFNAFLADKVATQTMKGGNTEMFYEKEGTLPKSEMQVKLHPDVSKLTFKWGRWHHHVDYSVFRTKLIRKVGLEIPVGINEYGMVLKRITQGVS